MKPRALLTVEAIRVHGRKVCDDSVIHQCRICALLNRVFLDEVRLSIGKERMPRGRRSESGVGRQNFGQSHPWRQDGRVSVMRHD
ncbi:MAG: hypothetical protein ACYDEA_10985 [Candidatus Dormibacteria bacterium]